jgi:hypothetical protein
MWQQALQIEALGLLTRWRHPTTPLGRRGNRHPAPNDRPTGADAPTRAPGHPAARLDQRPAPAR